MQVQENISLKSYNSFGLEAKARYFCETFTIGELQEVLSSGLAKKLPILILGGGSNILFTKDFPGLVIKMSIQGKTIMSENQHHVVLKAGAGVNWHELVMDCVDKGLGGIENLSLIPGTVGAAPMQNIGAYGVELEEVFDSLEAIEIATGKLRVFQKEECQFGYRYSIFKDENIAKGKYIIVNVSLKLNKQHTFNTSYGAIQQILQDMRVRDISIKAISEAVIHIRQSKLPDPAKLGNAGSFFKNPVIDREHFECLKSLYPEIPSYPLANGKVKIPAGWLIEQCQWKGKIINNVGVHKDQALVLVNYGGGKGKELLQLAQDIQASVSKKFSIDLSPEVNIV
jgi:UDP-N-acetylmuramate dehydrogenase